MIMPDSITLSDYTVLITRPEGQGENLCQLIESAGGKAVSFPVMRATMTDNVEACLNQFKSLTDFSHIIFVAAIQ
jgi:uroporphyrinogen-III synthase